MFHSHPLEMLSRPSLLLTRRRLAAGDAKPKSVSTAGDVKNHWWSKFSTHHYLGGGKFNTACDAFVFFVGGVVTKQVSFDKAVPRWRSTATSPARGGRCFACADSTGLSWRLISKGWESAPRCARTTRPSASRKRESRAA